MIDLLIIFLLILLNGFFALSEIAIISSKKIRLEALRSKHKRSVKCTFKLLENQEGFLSSIQVGITLVSFLTGFYGGTNIAAYIEPWFLQIGLSGTSAHNLAIILSIITITFIAIVIGELVPKTIALSNPERYALKIAPTIYVFSQIFSPVVKALEFSTKLIDKLLGVTKHEDIITEEELRTMIRDAGKTGVIEEEENIIHENLFYFADKKAKHIMTHRSEVEWIDINLSEEDFIQNILQVKSSKILVCDKYLDQYLGVLKVKEFLINKYENKEFEINNILTQPIIVPENAEAQDILTEFKKKQYYFCIVLDEFGTFEGLITLHDIVENIVGEIPEEEEFVEPDVFRRDEHSVLVNGDAPIEVLVDVIQGLKLDFETIDYSTVAGFVLNHIEKIPEIGDRFTFNKYTIEIIDIDHNRIDKVLISDQIEN